MTEMVERIEAALLQEGMRRERARAEDQAAIEEWLSTKTPQRMPKRSASAPPILAIRGALSRGNDIKFKRGRSGRTITFKSASVGADRIVHDEGAFGEDPWKDIAGYAIQQVYNQREAKQRS